MSKLEFIMTETDNELLNVFIKYVESNKTETLSESTIDTYNLIYTAICNAIKEQCDEFTVEIKSHLDNKYEKDITYAIYDISKMLKSHGWYPFYHESTRGGELTWSLSCKFRNYNISRSEIKN